MRKAEVTESRPVVWRTPWTHIETDYRHRISYYRAPAHACNTCSLKNNCTDSEEGRLLESRQDSWLESELRRFHRGISLVLFLLATVFLMVEAVRHTEGRDMLVAGCLLLPVVITETKLFVSFLARQQSKPGRFNES